MMGEIPVPIPVRKTECVYILRYRGVVVYVGISNQVLGRIGAHFNAGEIVFDSASYISMPDRETAMMLECKLVMALQPKHNTQMTKRAVNQFKEWYNRCGREWWGKMRTRRRHRNPIKEPT